MGRPGEATASLAGAMRGRREIEAYSCAHAGIRQDIHADSLDPTVRQRGEARLSLSASPETSSSDSEQENGCRLSGGGRVSLVLAALLDEAHDPLKRKTPACFPNDSPRFYHGHLSLSFHELCDRTTISKMAVSLLFHPGPECSGEAIINTTEDAGRWRMPSPIDESRAPAKGCSIDMIASKFDTCAKATVFANMAYDLFVLGSELSHDRKNWACPFGHCKLNFANPKALMHHVPECPDFSSDKVFCNCCNEDHRFQEHCRDNRAETIASHGTEKSFAKKRNPIRKLSNIFSRNRIESRGSSPSSECPVSPFSTHRRPSILSLMTPTPSPPNASRRGSSPRPQEPDRGASIPASPSNQEAFSELIGSEPLIIRGIQELHSREVPSELSDATRAQELPGQMFSDIEMCESPTTENLHMDSTASGQDLFQAYNASLARQVEASQIELPSTNSLDSAFQPQHQLQPCSLMQPLQQLEQQLQEDPWLHSDSHSSAAAVQEGMYSTGGSMSSHDGFSILPGQSHHQQMIPSADSNHISGQTRKYSGDSAYSRTSSATMAIEHTPQNGAVHQPTFDAGRLTGSPFPTAQMSAIAGQVTAEPAEDQDLRCPFSDCDYRPKGSRRENYSHYRRKHIENTHLHRYRVRCPDCGSLLSRSDNLRVHQETAACPRARSFGAPYPPHRSARRYGPAQRREW
ncbi:hypothetical protein NCS52_00467200 [Fusarium sp. LHS14.1]|nr:hypothetical protein NCS52_00467200 [Fusarium sp. LHS14.1]